MPSCSPTVHPRMAQDPAPRTTWKVFQASAAAEGDRGGGEAGSEDDTERPVTDRPLTRQRGRRVPGRSPSDESEGEEGEVGESLPQNGADGEEEVFRQWLLSGGGPAVINGRGDPSISPELNRGSFSPSAEAIFAHQATFPTREDEAALDLQEITHLRKAVDEMENILFSSGVQAVCLSEDI